MAAFLRAGGREVPGDSIVSLTLRSDLTPIPLTLEGQFIRDERLAAAMVEGAVIEVGQGVEYRVMKSVPSFAAIGEQQGRPTAAIQIVAYLNRAHAIAYRRRTAVVKENATLGGIYAACGAQTPIAQDFRVPRFACYVGETPSYQIAALLQEEGGAIYWRDGSIRFARLRDLQAGVPVSRITASATTLIESQFLERHQVPWFYSARPDGALIFGNRSRERAVMYSPRKDEMTLRNMTRCLITRRTATGLFRPDINAGDVFEVDGRPQVVVTAAHHVASAADGSATRTFSKFWLGEVDE